MSHNLLNKNGLNEKEYIEAYDISRYDQPSVTVDMLLFTISSEEVNNYRKVADKSLRILLIQRNEHPYIGQWALPGGFVRMNEDLETAAYRELKEETGIDNAFLEQLYTYGQVGRDPRGRIISTSYMSLVNETEMNTKAGSDAADARWFDVKYKLLKEELVKDDPNQTDNDQDYVENKYIEIALTCEELKLSSMIKVSRIVKGRHVSYKREIVESKEISFDHGLIIQYGVERLRNKLESTDIIYHMMPDLFTLTELQKSYEVILDKKLLKANFRRKTAKYVSETEHSTSDAGHRPSKLYKFNTQWEK